MIQLSDLDLHEVENLFPHKDLRDYVFQYAIIKELCLGRCFKLIIKEKAGLDEHIQVANLIPSTLEEETIFLDADGMP
jgi:hypothetical protein